MTTFANGIYKIGNHYTINCHFSLALLHGGQFESWNGAVRIDLPGESSVRKSCCGDHLGQSIVILQCLPTGPFEFPLNSLATGLGSQLHGLLTETHFYSTRCHRRS